MYKFNIIGANADVDIAAAEDLYSVGGTYPLQLAALASTIKSSSVADDVGSTGAETVRVHGIDENNRYQTEVASMNGTADVNLDHSYLDVFLIEVLTAGSGGVNAGLISVEHGGATTINTIAIGDNVSKSAVFTGADKVKMEIRSVGVHMLNKIDGMCKFELKTRKLGSGAWVTRWSTSCHGLNQPSKDHVFEAPIPLEAGETAKLVATVTTDNTSVEGTIEVVGSTAPRL